MRKIATKLDEFKKLNESVQEDFKEESLTSGHPLNVEYHVKMAKEMGAARLFSCFYPELAEIIASKGKLVYAQDGYDDGLEEVDDAYKIYFINGANFAVTRDGVVYAGSEEDSRVIACDECGGTGEIDRDNSDGMAVLQDCIFCEKTGVQRY